MGLGPYEIGNALFDQLSHNSTRGPCKQARHWPAKPASAANLEIGKRDKGSPTLRHVEGWATALLRIAAELLFQPVYSVFEATEFRLLGPQLFLGFHFCGLLLLFLRRYGLEIRFDRRDLLLGLFLLCWRSRTVVCDFFIVFHGARQLSLMFLGPREF